MAGLDLEAHSVGGVETCFIVPSFDVCLDIGRCPPGAERRRVLLLTHGHIDHAAGLPYYVSLRALYGMRPPKVYCPEPSAAALKNVLDAWTALDSDSDHCTLLGARPGDQIPLLGGYAQVFRSPHRVATVGYTLVRRVRKLLPELQGLTGEQIGAKARAGENIHQIIERAELCFPGDTKIDVVESEPTVTTARVLLLECTFVGDVPLSKAKQTGHVHLDQIAERADLFQNEVIVLTHFSKRHDRSEIEAEVAKLPDHLRARIQVHLPR